MEQEIRNALIRDDIDSLMDVANLFRRTLASIEVAWSIGMKPPEVKTYIDRAAKVAIRRIEAVISDVVPGCTECGATIHEPCRCQH